LPSVKCPSCGSELDWWLVCYPDKGICDLAAPGSPPPERRGLRGEERCPKCGGKL